MFYKYFTKNVDPAPEVNEQDATSDFLRMMIAEIVANGRFTDTLKRVWPRLLAYFHNQAAASAS